jgi:hypothetical protein
VVVAKLLIAVVVVVAIFTVVLLAFQAKEGGRHLLTMTSIAAGVHSRLGVQKHLAFQSMEIGFAVQSTRQLLGAGYLTADYRTSDLSISSSFNKGAYALSAKDVPTGLQLPRTFQISNTNGADQAEFLAEHVSDRHWELWCL